MFNSKLEIENSRGHWFVYDVYIGALCDDMICFAWTIYQTNAIFNEQKSKSKALHSFWLGLFLLIYSFCTDNFSVLKIIVIKSNGYKRTVIIKITDEFFRIKIKINVVYGGCAKWKDQLLMVASLRMVPMKANDEDLIACLSLFVCLFVIHQVNICVMVCICRYKFFSGGRAWFIHPFTQPLMLTPRSSRLTIKHFYMHTYIHLCTEMLAIHHFALFTVLFMIVVYGLLKCRNLDWNITFSSAFESATNKKPFESYDDVNLSSNIRFRRGDSPS